MRLRWVGVSLLAAAGAAALTVAWSGCTTTGGKITTTPVPTATAPPAGTWTPLPTDTASYTISTTSTRTSTRTFTISHTRTESWTPSETFTPTNTPIPAPFPFCDNFESAAWGPAWFGGLAGAGTGCMGVATPCQDLGGGSRTFSTAYAQSGTYSVLLGSNTGAGNGADWIAFTIPLPSAGTPTLTFWWRHFASDYQPFDPFLVEIRDSSCAAMLASVLCDLPPSSTQCGGTTYDSTWQQVSFPLTSFLGQTVTVWFANVEVFGCVPSFTHLDDVCVQ